MSVEEWLDNSKFTEHSANTSILRRRRRRPLPEGRGFGGLEHGYGAGDYGAGYDDIRPLNLDRPTEDMVKLIRTVGAIDEARQDALLEGIILAHEQVQDQLIRLARSDKEPESSWWVVAEIALTFFLQSPILGKWASNAAQRILGSTLRNHVVVSRIVVVDQRLSLQQALQQAPPADALPSYIRFLQGVATAEPATWQTVSAVGKAGTAGWKKYQALAPHSPGHLTVADNQSALLSPEDSAGVATLASAYEIRLRSRLATRLRTMELEWYVRTQAVDYKEMALLRRHLQQQLLPLEAKGRDGKKFILHLDTLRKRAARGYEATIWARTCQFSAEEEVPRKPELKKGEVSIQGVDRDVLEYLMTRFGDLVEEQPWYSEFFNPKAAGRSAPPFSQLTAPEKTLCMWQFLMFASESSPSPSPV
jgi:hypothetical protein